MEGFIKPLVALVLTWGAGLMSLWGVVSGLLEAGTLICGFLIGVLTVAKLLRDLGWIIPKPENQNHESG